MTGFVSIEESKQKFTSGESKSASFIVTVVEHKEPSGDKRPHRFTIDDGKTQEELTVWPDDASKLKVGYKYEITSPYWKDYQGTPQVSISQYSQIKCIGSAETQGKIDDTTPKEEPQPTEDFENEAKEVLSELKQGTTQAIVEETLLLLKIRKVVTDTVKKYEVDPHPGMIWEMTSEIYEKMFNNFEKGSQVD